VVASSSYCSWGGGGGGARAGTIAAQFVLDDGRARAVAIALLEAIILFLVDFVAYCLSCLLIAFHHNPQIHFNFICHVASFVQPLDLAIIKNIGCQFIDVIGLE
jgi:hypothetical protein